jgi:hypothetical protein
MDRRYVIQSPKETASVVSYTNAIDVMISNGSHCCSEQNIPVHAMVPMGAIPLVKQYLW